MVISSITIVPCNGRAVGVLRRVCLTIQRLRYLYTTRGCVRVAEIINYLMLSWKMLRHAITLVRLMMEVGRNAFIIRRLRSQISYICGYATPASGTRFLSYDLCNRAINVIKMKVLLNLLG